MTITTSHQRKSNKPLNNKSPTKLKDSDEIDSFLTKFINRVKDVNKNHLNKEANKGTNLKGFLLVKRSRKQRTSARYIEKIKEKLARIKKTFDNSPRVLPNKKVPIELPSNFDIDLGS